MLAAALTAWLAAAQPVPASVSERAQVVELARLYQADPALVAALRALGYSWSDTECAVAIARRARRPITEVLDLREAGLAWGEVARGYGFMLTDAVLSQPGAEGAGEGGTWSERER